MGVVCSNNCERDEGTQTADSNKNSLQLQGSLGQHCTVHLIFGHHKQGKAEGLLVITDSKSINQCQPIQEYASDFRKTTDYISNMRKTLYKAPTKKNCQYSRLFICVLPPYKSEDCDSYQQQFRNMLKQTVEDAKQLALYMCNTIEGVQPLPNQMLIAVMLRELLQIERSFRLKLMTCERKMMNMYKFQLLKTDACHINCTEQ